MFPDSVSQVSGMPSKSLLRMPTVARRNRPARSPRRVPACQSLLQAPAADLTTTGQHSGRLPGATGRSHRSPEKPSLPRMVRKPRQFLCCRHPAYRSNTTSAEVDQTFRHQRQSLIAARIPRLPPPAFNTLCVRDQSISSGGEHILGKEHLG
jgi:hypothetical protein